MNHASTTVVVRHRCGVIKPCTAMSTVRVWNQEPVFVCAASSAIAFACDGTGSHSSIASATAEAYASAIAGIVGGCVLAGDASAKVYASAQARAGAEIWVSAFFEAMASAATCEKCAAFADSWGYIKKWVFLEAIAKAEYKVCLPSADRAFQHSKHTSPVTGCAPKHEEEKKNRDLSGIL
jgi:hypothetical protein